jgi:hypothetical protein
MWYTTWEGLINFALKILQVASASSVNLYYKRAFSKFNSKTYSNAMLHFVLFRERKQTLLY